MAKIFEFESKQEKYVLLATFGLVFIVAIITFYPIVESQLRGKIDGQATVVQNTESSLGLPKTPREYYDMFQCSCCGRPIDVGCCGMAKQRKAHLDKLLLQNLEENEIIYQMVKKFGFDVLMDPSKEQEVRDYIKSQASDNPPRIEIENTQYDFGTIKQSGGIVSTIFTIKNTGKSDLTIDNLDSSCMCTTASLTYKGQEGPIFGMSMHGDNPEDYSLNIPPGESAQLKVYYDPMAHGIQKKPQSKIIREVTIISNDPIDFQKKVRIEITQIP